MKVVNYFIRMSIVIFMFIVAKSSSDIKIATVENNNVNNAIMPAARGYRRAVR